MAAAVTPAIALVGNIPAAPVIPVGASRATINVQIPPGEGVQQSGYIIAELAVVAEGSAWTSAHAYTAGNQVKDSNGNMQQCIVGGTSGGSHPTWGTGLGETTADGSGALIWQNIGTAIIDLVAGPCTVYVTQP